MCRGSRTRRSAIVAVLALSLGGCALATGAKVVDLYDLTAPDLSQTVRGGTRSQLLIPEPNAVQALNTNQIVIRTDQSTLGYIGGGQWADTLPKLVQARLVQAFEQTGRVAAVGTPGEGLFINHTVRVTIRFFGLDVNGARRARLDFAAKIMNEGTGRVVAVTSISESVPAGPGTEGAVDALDAAFGNASQTLVQWVVSKI
ncbi:MAG: ABC-type transport auxiliary lipoprotein family protein [Pseudomonadota bacterium]